MGKKKGGFKTPAKSKVGSLKNAVSDSDDDEIEQHLQSVLEDEIDQYNAFKDNALLDKAKKGKGKKAGRKGVADDDEEQEVYELGLTSSEEEDDEEEGIRKKKDYDFDHDDEDEDDDMSDLDDDDDDEDIMGERDQEERIPDSRAWGKKAKIFHNTDYVDQDFGGFEGSDAENAEQDEAAAKEIQKRLTADLDESDFLGLIPVEKKGEGKKDKGKSKELLKIDFDKMSIAEKRKLVERECPEVIHLVDEFKEKLKEANIVKKEMTNVTGHDKILQLYYQSKFHAILNYCINISYYLYLRSTSPTNCKGHPVIKRILQFRRLIDELAQFDPDKYQPSQNSSGPAKSAKLKRKRPLPSFGGDEEIPLGEAGMGASLKNKEPTEEFDEGGEKRGITYAIAKNKGLTPKRKREQRNPRVKHREKFRKAQVRRKGQVRTARTEVQKYGGEASGIKSHLTKSVKLQ